MNEEYKRMQKEAEFYDLVQLAKDIFVAEIESGGAAEISSAFALAEAFQAEVDKRKTAAGI